MSNKARLYSFLLSIANIPSSICTLLEASGIRIVTFNPDERRKAREEQLSKSTVGNGVVEQAFEKAGISKQSQKKSGKKFKLVSARGTRIINNRKIIPGNWFSFLFEYLGNSTVFMWGIEEIHIAENSTNGQWDLNITISSDPKDCAERCNEDVYETSTEIVDGEEKEITRLVKISRETLHLFLKILTQKIECVDKVEFYDNSNCLPPPGKLQNPNVLRLVKPIALNGKKPKLLEEVLGNYSNPITMIG